MVTSQTGTMVRNLGDLSRIIVTESNQDLDVSPLQSIQKIDGQAPLEFSTRVANTLRQSDNIVLLRNEFVDSEAKINERPTSRLEDEV